MEVLRAPEGVDSKVYDAITPEAMQQMVDIGHVAIEGAVKFRLAGIFTEVIGMEPQHVLTHNWGDENRRHLYISGDSKQMPKLRAMLNRLDQQALSSLARIVPGMGEVIFKSETSYTSQYYNIPGSIGEHQDSTDCLCYVMSVGIRGEGHVGVWLPGVWNSEGDNPEPDFYYLMRAGDAMLYRGSIPMLDEVELPGHTVTAIGERAIATVSHS